MVYQKDPEQFHLMGLLKEHGVGRGGGINSCLGGGEKKEVFLPISYELTDGLSLLLYIIAS